MAKIAVINFSGNVGKTTIARQLLGPGTLPGVRRIVIENINATAGNENDVHKSALFLDIAAEIGAVDDEQHFVLDLGASAVLDVIDKLHMLRSTRNEMDRWIIPTVAKEKQLADTISTILHLTTQFKLKPERIVVVANIVEDVDNFAVDFAPVIETCRLQGIKFCTQAILASDAFPQMADREGTIIEYADAEIDFKSKIRELNAAGDKDGALEASRERILHDQCWACAENLRAVFNEAGLNELIAA